MRYFAIPRKSLSAVRKLVGVAAVAATLAIAGGHALALPMPADPAAGCYPGAQETTIKDGAFRICALLADRNGDMSRQAPTAASWTGRIMETVLAFTIRDLKHLIRTPGPEAGLLASVGMMIGVIALKRRMGK